MTVIVTIDCFDELLIVTDTRISYPDGTFHPNMGVQKALIFGTRDNWAVLGFCGPVIPAKRIINQIFHHKLSNNKKPFVFFHFKESLRRWFEEYIQAFRVKDLRGLQFILCGFESRRKRPLISDGQIRYTNWYERHIYIYTVTKRKQVEVNKGGLVNVLGSGQKLQHKIINQINDLIKFGRGMPNFHDVRAFMSGEIISLIYQDEKFDSVGGPFKVIQLAPPSFTFRYVWSPSVESKIEVSESKGNTIIKNLKNQNVFTVIPIINPKQPK